jgi:hypothetical protein
MISSIAPAGFHFYGSPSTPIKNAGGNIIGYTKRTRQVLGIQSVSIYALFLLLITKFTRKLMLILFGLINNKIQLIFIVHYVMKCYVIVVILAM